MRFLLFFLPLFLLSESLIIKYLNLKPFYYENQIINLNIKIISPVKNLNITSTYNIKLNISNKNPYIYLLNLKFKANNNPKFLFISSNEINKTIFLNSKINIKQLNKINNFSNLLADELNISTPVAIKSPNNNIILSFTIKCKNCNLKDFHLTNKEKLKIINSNTATYLANLPKNTQNFEFYYFNTKKQTYQKVSVPIKLKDETISTQTNINPKENKFFTPLNIFILIIIAIFLLFFLIFQKIWILIFPIIIGGFLIHSLLPKGEIYLHKGDKLTILPTYNSTVIYIVEKDQKVKILNRSRDYVEVKIKNKIGWVKQ